MMFALIPAAGRSRRMGRPKLGMHFRGRPVLEHVVDALRVGGVRHVLVVVGAHVPLLAEIGERAGASAWISDRPTPDMRSTVLLGLQWIEREWSPAAEDAWMLCPGDQPTLSAEVVRSLVGAWDDAGRDFSIAVPTHGGERGHPTVIGWGHVAGIRAMPDGVGLNSYLRRHAADAREIPFDRPEVLADMDTPEDYRRLLNGDE